MSVVPKEGGLSAVTDIMVSAAAGLPAFAALRSRAALDFQLHQPLGGEGDHVAQNVGVG
jgi:hypothetical protein